MLGILECVQQVEDTPKQPKLPKDKPPSTYTGRLKINLMDFRSPNSLDSNINNTEMFGVTLHAAPLIFPQENASKN
jgi:hypothetical protein